MQSLATPSPKDNAPEPAEALPGTNLPLQGFGMGFFIAWCICRSYVQPHPLHSAEHGTGVLVEIVVIYLVAVATFAVFSYRQRKLGATLRNRSLGILVCASAIVGSALLMASGYVPAAPVFGVAGSLLIGFATALYFLKWNCLYAALPMRQACICYAGAFLASGVIYFALVPLPGILSGIVSCLLPLCATLCYSRTRHMVLETPGAVIEDGENWSFPVQSAAIVFVGTLAFYFLQVLGQDQYTFDWVGNIALGLVALIVAFTVFDRATTKFLEALALPAFLAAVMVWLLVGSAAYPLVGPLANFGYAALLMLNGIIVCSISFHYGANPVGTFALSGVVICVAHLLGLCCGYAVRFFPDEQGELAAGVVLIVCMVVLTVLHILFVSHGTGGNMGTAPQDEDNERPEFAENLPYFMSYYEALIWRSKKFALAYNLTHREEELLALLAQGLSNTEVEEKLNLSKNTVKTHLRHIYTKTSTHSRDELVSLFEKVS